MIKLKDLLNEGLDPKAQKFLDAIQVIDRDIKDLKHITVDVTPQGNWSVYFKGKRMGTINGRMLDDRTIMKYGLEETMSESIESMKKELMKEVSDEAYTLHRFTACGQNAAQDFIDDNKIDAKKLIKFLKRTDNEGLRNRYMVRDIIAGKTDKNVKQKFIKLYKESMVKESVESMKRELMKQLQWVTIQLKKSTNSSDVRKYTKIKNDAIAKLDHIKKTGKYENVNEDGFPGGAGVGLSLPGGYINGAPSYDKVKSTKKRIQNDKNDRYTGVQKK